METQVSAEVKIPPYVLQIWLFNGAAISAMFDLEEDALDALEHIHSAQQKMVFRAGEPTISVPVKVQAANGTFVFQPGSIGAAMVSSYAWQNEVRVVQGKLEIDLAKRINDRGPMGIGND